VPTDTVASQKAMGDHGHKGTGRHNPADTGTPEVPHGEHHHPHSPIADKLYTWAWLRWDSLAADGNRRRVPGTALFAAIGLLVGLIASVWTTHSGINLAYADAQSHLTIARRVFDSKAPGFEQLGTVWLPVPHLLLIPLVTSLWLWHTGWAACLLGMGCLSCCCGSLYRISARLNFSRTARLVVLGAFLSCPSLLYVFTTALTEPVLIACMLGCFAGLAGWSTSTRKLSGGELAVFAGIPAAAAVLSRYEGWALVVAGSVFVLVVSHRRWGSWRYAMRMVWCFVATPAAAITWWLSYNWAIYGNPLEFMFGPYSAWALQKPILDSGMLPTKGNFGLSLWTYDWSLLAAAGAVVLVLAILGGFALTWTRGLSNTALLVWLMGCSYVFSVLSLTLGQSVIYNNHSFPAGWWNNRYSLSVLPFLVILVGVLSDYVGRAIRITYLAAGVTAVIVLALAGQTWWAFSDLAGRSAVIAEAQQYMVANAEATAAGQWLGAHYDGGNILMDESAPGNAILPVIGVPLNQYYNQSTGPLFQQALEDPTTHARWIFLNVADTGATSGPRDVVAQHLLADPSFAVSYRWVFGAGAHRVYELLDSGTIDQGTPPAVATEGSP
jgi:hypothetical protein